MTFYKTITPSNVSTPLGVMGCNNFLNWLNQLAA